MEQEKLRILIADDEDIVREGLKHVIDWNRLGFFLCAEAADGDEALEKIRLCQPHVVLLDVRMPSMDGTRVISEARKQGYAGEFIFLSGYSDFSYAQTALQYGASFYLTKPINEEELEKAVLSVREKILQSLEKEKSFSHFVEKARLAILRDLLLGNPVAESVDFMQLGLSACVYQVVLYCSYTPFFAPYRFGDLLRIANRNHLAFEQLSLDTQDVILLKGSYALDKFQSCLSHYKNGTQKGSPLDSVFITYGRPVFSLQDIPLSLQDCRQLMERRFYCAPNQHVLSYETLPAGPSSHFLADSQSSAYYSRLLIDAIQTKKRSLLSATLHNLEKSLQQTDADAETVKHFLIDIFLQVKQAVTNRYPHLSIPFDPNASVIGLLEKKNYLYEIIRYFKDQTDMILRAVGQTTNDLVFGDIVDYIDHNYASNLKLDDLATLFGYNTSYLGKLFTKKMGKNFNAYLDEVRIQNAAQLLRSSDLKIYEIALRTGYSNVNYFYQKFHHLMGVSPSAYKKKQ